MNRQVDMLTLVHDSGSNPEVSGIFFKFFYFERRNDYGKDETWSSLYLSQVALAELSKGAWEIAI